MCCLVNATTIIERLIVVILTCLLICSQLPVSAAPASRRDLQAAGAIVEPLLDDPDLLNRPVFSRMGSKGDFSGEWTRDPQDSADGVAILEWNHDRQSLDWVSSWDPNTGTPPSMDYIYFTQSFDWTHNLTPSAVAFYIEFAVEVTGDFGLVAGESWFDLYFWLVDPSANWYLMYTSAPPYSTEMSRRTIPLDIVDIYNVFGGTVQYMGEQEDPSDTITVAIGLAPSQGFANYETQRTGSVRLIIDKVYGEAKYHSEDSDQLSPLITPEYSSVWLTGDTVSKLVTDVEPAPSGDIYVTGPRLVRGHVVDSFLCKLDSRAQPVWNVSINLGNVTWASGLSVNNESVVVFGEVAAETSGLDAFVGVWATNESQMMLKRINLGVFTSVVAGDPLPNGQLLLLWDDFAMGACYLSKLSSSGVVVWTTAVSSNLPALDLAVDSEGNAYVLDPGSLTKVDPDGQVVWTTTEYGLAIEVLSDEEIAVVGNGYVAVPLSVRHSSNGSMMMSRELTRKYSSDFTSVMDLPLLYLDSVSGADGSFYLLFVSGAFFTDLYLYHIGSDLAILGNWTFTLSERLRSPWARLDVSDGHVLFSGSIYVAPEDVQVLTAMYFLPPGETPLATLPIASLIVTGCAVVVALVVADTIRIRYFKGGSAAHKSGGEEESEDSADDAPEAGLR